jgi:tellurite resistance protein TerC
MLAGTPLSWWIGFHVFVGILLVVDLFVLQRKDRPVSKTMAIGWTLFLALLAGAFTLLLLRAMGHQSALEFASGYLIEGSLSVDNLFVFLMMFRSLGLGRDEQRRALLWGVLGAIVMRAVFIATGVSLLARFEWIQYVFGAFLLVAAVRLLRHSPSAGGPSKSVRWIQRMMMPKPRPSGAQNEPPKLAATTFVFVILAVEVTDLIFALDSIPAVLAITRHPFLVYTSNIFAILGLRSLFFVLAGLLDSLRLLHYGLGAILAFVALKMVFAHWITVPVVISLAVILGILAICTVASLIQNRTRPNSRLTV